MHGYPRRKVRSPSEGVNVELIIITIICPIAKSQGKQYNKRLLPSFIVPFRVISREAVLGYLRRYPDGAFHYRDAISLLGAVDRRTIRRHIAQALHLIKKAALELTRLLAGVPLYAVLPPHKVEDSAMQQLEKATAEVKRAQQRSGGGRALTLPPLVFVHVVGVVERSRTPPPIPMTSVIKGLVFHDTS